MLGRPVKALWKKLIRLQPDLRTLSKPVSDLQVKITEARVNLDQTYTNLRHHHMNEQCIEAVRQSTEDLV